MSKRQEQDAHHRAVVGTYYQDKDEGPLGEVMEQLRARLLRLLRGSFGVREPALAEDVAQAALTELLQALRAGRYNVQQASLATYASTICWREWLHTQRHESSRPGTSESPFLLLPANPAEDFSQAAENVVAAASILSAATQAVLALDHPARAAVVLHFYHGLDAPAAAAHLGIGEYAFRERLRRGLAALQAWGRTVPHPAAEVYAALRGVDSGDLFREPLRMAS